MTAQEKFNRRNAVAKLEVTANTSRTTGFVEEEPIQLTFSAELRHLRVRMDAREAMSLGRQLMQHAENWQAEQRLKAAVESTDEEEKITE